ncbi:S23 ribosomal protein [Rivularia sp. PCC 7116]|uniref:four helix bundle protein n=1 Tax=Rivularia sp. PCC 7116 TaxID=373994 RepID=UPI00029F0EE8|nr:four helix bundle protein [Rivularia sp. PCC 7116]AFY53812.1 S23 ribosomal protein [Rivularia sp. PCC 7116]
MEKSNFENLRVFQLAEKLADYVWNIVIFWNQLATDTVGKQIIRSADSIGANIAEGSGRYNFKDNLRFVKIARASLHETRYWLRRAYTRKLLTNEQINVIQPIVDELSPKLNAYFKYSAFHLSAIQFNKPHPLPLSFRQ